MPKRVATLILAAGSSTRMGHVKQLLPLKDATLLGVVIEKAQETETDEVFCVLGANSSEIEASIEKYKVEIIINPNHQNGLSSSIVSGINHLIEKNWEAVLIILGDQPLICVKYLNELINAFKKTPKNIMATEYHDSLGVPVIIPKLYFKNLLQLKGDKGAKEFLHSQKDVVKSFKSDSLFDVDSKEDYIELLKKLNQ